MRYICPSLQREEVRHRQRCGYSNETFSPELLEEFCERHLARPQARSLLKRAYLSSFVKNRMCTFLWETILAVPACRPVAWVCVPEARAESGPELEPLPRAGVEIEALLAAAAGR